MHFSGDQAFDMHRIGEFGGPIELEDHTRRYDPCTRRCASPHDLMTDDDVPLLIPATTDGRCTVYADREGYGPEYGIVIWRANPARKGRVRVRSADDL